MQITELEKRRHLLYTRAKLEKKLPEEVSGYGPLAQGVRESNDQSLKLKTLETLICLRIQFGSQADEQMSKAVRVYCECLGLDLTEAKETIGEIVDWFKLWIDSKWPFNL